MVRYLSSASLVLALTFASAWPCRPAAQGRGNRDSLGNELTISVGGKAFAATLLDNPSAAAFKAMLPLSITMTELNGNEKFARLAVTVPTQASTPPSIQAGDLMLYGSNTLVLFYKSFRTTYSYTKIGRIDHPAGLAGALGPGDVSVTFAATRDKG